MKFYLSILILLPLVSFSQEDPCKKMSDMGLVFLKDIAPSIKQDMRYSTDKNFLNKPLTGYNTGQEARNSDCIVRKEVAEALKQAQARLKSKNPNHSLVMYDCYRPNSAVNDMNFGSINPYYTPDRPTFLKNKSKYIAAASKGSGHSTGGSVDIGIVDTSKKKSEWSKKACKFSSGTKKDCRCGARQKDQDEFMPLSFGTSFDCFHKHSHTHDGRFQHDHSDHDHPHDEESYKNRQLLISVMENKKSSRCNFSNYSKEWWHFSFKCKSQPEEEKERWSKTNRKTNMPIPLYSQCGKGKSGQGTTSRSTRSRL